MFLNGLDSTYTPIFFVFITSVSPLQMVPQMNLLLFCFDAVEVGIEVVEPILILRSGSIKRTFLIYTSIGTNSRQLQCDMFDLRGRPSSLDCRSLLK